MNNYRLTIELIPASSFYQNVRALVSPKRWDNIKRACFDRAGNRCEICGGIGKKHPVECHERWEFDEANGIQKLVGLIALCPSCHMVKHIGFARVRGNYQPALLHLAKVNKISLQEADIYVDKCFEIWEKRSEKEWKVDISDLNLLAHIPLHDKRPVRIIQPHLPIED